MRKLPVYFLIDVSESMAGEPIQEVEKGMKGIIQDLRHDPYALETVYISILVFAGQAEVLVPLTELYAFQTPNFPIGSGTALGKGLELLMKCIDAEVRQSTAQAKGDWKPIVFLFTDGAATDNCGPAIEKWRRNYSGKCELIVVTFGRSADVGLLERLGGQVLTLTDLGPDSFKEFFKWVSASIMVSSVAVNEGRDANPLEGRSCINLEKGEASKRVDENWIILTGKCGKKKDCYIVKYQPADERGGRGKAPYELVGAYAIDPDAYARLGGASAPKMNVNSDLLGLVPACPCCGNPTSLLHCNNCSNIFCGPNAGEVTCPWCGNQGKIVNVDNLEFSRSQG